MQRFNTLKRVLGCLLLALPLICAPVHAQTSSKLDAEHDIRVIIDVSGSMKQNDPANLRIPAMKLLIGLLPADTYTGIWTFAKYVNMIVKPGLASKQWKEKAVRATSKIHSRGLFTDIEQAFNKATWDWKEAPENTQRSIILLTDGVVDVSKKSLESDASRDRILTDLLPRMQEVGAVIHTIALSENADLELMKLMSVATDGWQETVTDADQLQRIFLRMFEKSIQPETVPLEGNRFTIDGSISELTVLAFTRDDKQPVSLVSPDGSEYSAAKHPKTIRWQENTGYSMVTIEKPVTGEWRLVADVDPDNRVMIVTDLKFRVGRLPNNLLAGETLEYEAGLTEKGKTITRSDFLDLVDVQLSHQTVDSDPISTTLVAERDTGLYKSSLENGLAVGRYELLSSAESPTFKRERRHTLQVHDSPVEISVEEDTESAAATVNIRAKADLVQLQSLQFSGLILAPDQSTSIAELQAVETGHWQIKITDPIPGVYQINLSVGGNTEQGREFELQLPLIKLGQEVVVEEAPPIQEEEAEPPAEPVVEADPMNTILVIGIANLLLLIPAALAFLLWRRRKKKNAKGE